MLITIREYAQKHNLSYGTVRNAISKGLFKPDEKIKNQWYVEDTKPWYSDKRMLRIENNSYSRVYNIWRCMKQRCLNKNHNAYYRYGGRGIKVCDEWIHNSKAFIIWALENGYNDNLELDRIDNDGDYSPSNCQWITHKENIRKAPNTLTYKSDEAYYARLFFRMKKHGVDPSKYHLDNPYK